MKTIHKQIILIIALIITIAVGYYAHIIYDSQEMFNQMKSPAIVTHKDWFNITITDSTGLNYHFKRNDMLGNSLMNIYNLKDTVK